ncbi:hypothetical protein I5E68_08145 [Novosphingobium sp. YJ-S2-02]|uniref:Uncharacterized protein n=1 Tax=Novosphingobium aureum TaxID=2792964 RepID=A0A931HBF1_9SPHN|nr:hypothetical protein [Novosphingobium aureum]MBH0112920.1 hypothetical protein [Novosphingobium aureum]
MSFLIGLAFIAGMASLSGVFSAVVLHRALRVPAGAWLLAASSLLGGAMATLAMLTVFSISDAAMEQALVVILIYYLIAWGLGFPACFMLVRRYRREAGRKPGGDVTAVFE